MESNGASAIARKSVTLPLKNGKHLELGQLLVQDFMSLREEARADYVRSLIQTYTRNLDLVPEEQRATITMQAFEKAEKITVDSLPPKKAWVAKRDPKTGKLVRHRGERFRHKESGQWVEDGAPLLTEEEIDYAGWWQAQTKIGLLHVLLRSLRRSPGQEHLTLDDVIQLFSGDDEEMLEEAGNIVGELSSRRLGNELPPAVTAGAV